VDAFRHLDIVMTTISDDRTVESHEVLLEEDTPMAQSMPRRFTTLDEAKLYWSIVVRRAFHFMGTTWRRTSPKSLVRELATKIPNGVVTTLGDNIYNTSYEVDGEVAAGQRRHYRELAHWLDAFAAPFLDIRRAYSLTSRHYIVAATLQMQILTVKIAVAGVGFTKETAYEMFHADFAEIVRLATDISTACPIDKQSDFWSGCFVLDLGINTSLFFLLLRCRDWTLRRQAIAILEKWHVEGVADPLLMIAVGRFIMEVEEEGMVDGFIPEEARAILTTKCHCPPDRVMLLQCVRRTAKGLVWTERFVSW